MRVTPDDLASCRVAIAGLGLMGGSLALALSGKCAELLAVDTDPMVVVKALQQHVVDQASTDAAEILPHADLIVLATPILTIIDLLEQLPVFCPEQTMVIDFGSTKSAIAQKMQELPEYFDPIGGHPMCGKELGGLSNADSILFRDAAFALIPLEHACFILTRKHTICGWQRPVTCLFWLQMPWLRLHLIRQLLWSVLVCAAQPVLLQPPGL
jgi:prephenate dehydrogenase